MSQMAFMMVSSWNAEFVYGGKLTMLRGGKDRSTHLPRPHWTTRDHAFSLPRAKSIRPVGFAHF